MPSTIQDLCLAISQNTSDDAFSPALSAPQWELVGTYMQAFELAAGQVLIDQDAHDRTLFFLESGALGVHRINSRDKLQMVILNPGAVVGEGAFFSRRPRSASVSATGACRLWRLTPTRFSEMANRQPALALEFTLALGAVLAKRLALRPRRIAVT